MVVSPPPPIQRTTTDTVTTSLETCAVQKRNKWSTKGREDKCDFCTVSRLRIIMWRRVTLPVLRLVWKESSLPYQGLNVKCHPPCQWGSRRNQQHIKRRGAASGKCFPFSLRLILAKWALKLCRHADILHTVAFMYQARAQCNMFAVNFWPEDLLRLATVIARLISSFTQSLKQKKRKTSLRLSFMTVKTSTIRKHFTCKH